MLLLPKRPRLAEVVAALCGGLDPSVFDHELQRGQLRFAPLGRVWVGMEPTNYTAESEWLEDRAAWEFLATKGFIPDSWVDNPERKYWQSCPQSGATVQLKNGTTLSHQGTAPSECGYCHGADYIVRGTPGVHVGLNGIVAFASDVRNVLTAESIAREVWPTAALVWREVGHREWARYPPMQSPEDTKAHPLPAGTRAKILDLQQLGYSFEPIVTPNAVVLVIPAL